ncbi:MAG: IS110 family transposase [Actinomycetota bacterium]|nr:IS110 family transposase [Actinomycetota bacterium]
MKVMIGVDPHKGSHTAVAIDEEAAELAKLKVRATGHQLDELLEWATPFDNRTWAVESAWGLGYLVSQQLLDAGEEVLDVPATLAARVRVLGTGRSNKNDPKRRPVGGRGRPACAVTGLCSPKRRRGRAAPPGQAQQ